MRTNLRTRLNQFNNENNPNKASLANQAKEELIRTYNEKE